MTCSVHNITCRSFTPGYRCPSPYLRSRVSYSSPRRCCGTSATRRMRRITGKAYYRLRSFFIRTFFSNDLLYLVEILPAPRIENCSVEIGQATKNKSNQRASIILQRSLRSWFSTIVDDLYSLLNLFIYVFYFVNRMNYISFFSKR